MRRQNMLSSGPVGRWSQSSRSSLQHSKEPDNVTLLLARSGGVARMLGKSLRLICVCYLP